MVCTGTYVHSGDVITIGQALPTLRGRETGCVLKGPSGEMMVSKLWNPSKISQESLFCLKSKRGFHLLPCSHFNLNNFLVDISTDRGVFLVKKCQGFLV